ncbi:MAG: hypothetical protein U9P49_10880 [Thermodesulfobacteriota bacterium]|nr:hypothetical protein [Thermodesulfobacteriota bacterium]
MESIKGANVAPYLVQIAAKAMQNQTDIATARAKLALDTLKESGELLVEMMGKIGSTIDTYA